MLPIDWSTLGLQLGAFFVILVCAIVGLQEVRTTGGNALSTLGLWVNRLILPINEQGERFIVVAFGLIAGLCAILIGQFIFQDFPYSGDEWSYLLQADIFSRGYLHVDSPTHPRFFDVWAMVNNGKFYSWAPPGWPLLLLPGILFGVPWLINPILGALTLLVVYRIGILVYGRSTSLLALLFILCSPFFLLHSASYFAHPSSLLFIALCIFFYAKGLEKKASRDFFLAGLCGSMSFLIRPFDQVAVFSPLGVYLLLLVLRREVTMPQFLWFVIGHAVGVLLMPTYNYLQTGNPLTMGYQVGYDGPLFDFSLPGRQFFAEYFLHLTVWTFPFLPLLALIYSVWLRKIGKKDLTERRWDTLLFLIFLSNVFWYLFVPFHYWAGYGPRYYYGSFFAIALLGARGAIALMNRLKSRLADGAQAGMAAVALGTCIALSLGWLFPVKLIEAYGRVESRLALYREVAQEGLQNAVVFIRSVRAEFAPWNLTRNLPDFQGTVLYVHDLEALNHLLMRQYPGRRFFLYKYDETKKPILREIMPHEVMEAEG